MTSIPHMPTREMPAAVPGPLSVAILGFWHVHAADYARSVTAHPDTRLAAVWDPDAERGRAAAAELGVEFVEDLDGLLGRDDLDAVVVTTATDQHHDVLSRAARVGKHIFSEKLLAPTVAECEDVLRTASQNDVVVVVSLPRLYEGTTVAVKRLIDEGALGELTYTRVRLAHNGWIEDWLPERFADRQQAIGGALSDLGCHPAYLTQLFLGTTPSSVSASYTAWSGRAVEDNAVVTLAYPNGAIGVVEASFVTTPGAFALELRGTRGSVLFGFGGEKLLAKGERFGSEGWRELPIPAGEAPPFERWVEHIRSGTRADENLAAAVELTRLVVAANESAVRGTTIDYSINREEEAFHV